MVRMGQMLRRRKQRRLRRDPGEPAWMFIMERVAERAEKRRPFRIYPGQWPWKEPARIDDRNNTLLLACMKGMRDRQAADIAAATATDTGSMEL